MLKNTEMYEEQQSRNHFTYDDYRKKLRKRPNKDITIFISVFIVGVLMILGFAKVLSPNVDVGITDDKQYPSYTEEDDAKQASVDERLKKLQMEDTNDMFSPELDETIVLPTKKDKQKEKNDASELELRVSDPVQQSHIQETKTTKETPKETKETNSEKDTTQNSHIQTLQQTTSAPMTPARVVIGSYASEKQAEVAKTALQESGIGVTPIIKNVGGTYTLQVGSYSTKEKAQQAVSNLIKNNFPARVLD